MAPKASKPFSQQRGGQRSRTLAAFKDLVETKAGGDLVGLLQGILNQRWAAEAKKALITNRLTPILAAIGQRYSTAAVHERSQWLSLATLACSSTKEFTQLSGVTANSRAWKFAKQHAQKHGAGTARPPPPRPPSKQKIPDRTIQHIEEFIRDDKHSYSSPNRTVRVHTGPKQWEQQPVRYLAEPRSVLWLEFLAQHGNEANISLATFKKYIPKWAKTPKRKTDMCNTCYKAKQTQRALRRLLRGAHTACLKKANTSALPDACLAGTCEGAIEREQALPEDHRVLVTQMRDQIRDWQEHLKARHLQREAFNKEIESLAPGKGLLVIDFKENVALGQSAEETSHCFYNRPQRTLFGAVLAYYNSSTSRVEFRYFDVVSADLTHDAWFVRNALMCLMQSAAFRQLQLQQLSIWSDQGPNHFHNAENMGNLADLCSAQLPQITMNFFCANHGKSMCDAHFSMVSAAIKQWTLHPAHHLHTTADLVLCLNDMFGKWKALNDVRIEHGAKKKKVWDFSILHMDEVISPPAERMLVSIKDFSVYHCFHFQYTPTNTPLPITLQASVFSHFSPFTSIEYSVENDKRTKTSLKRKRGFADYVGLDRNYDKVLGIKQQEVIAKRRKVMSKEDNDAIAFHYWNITHKSTTSWNWADVKVKEVPWYTNLQNSQHLKRKPEFQLVEPSAKRQRVGA
jgi:hypothetical protein